MYIYLFIVLYFLFSIAAHMKLLVRLSTCTRRDWVKINAKTAAVKVVKCRR